MNPNLYALIVGGGSGNRMNDSQPKQFLPVKNLPIAMHTLNAFHKANVLVKIILVIPKDYFQLWEELCFKYSFRVPHELIQGGKTRTESVKNGLAVLPEDGIVAIHDAVRPLVSEQIINNSYQYAEVNGCAVTSILLKDSLRQIDGEQNFSVNRENYRIIQTPQTFQLNLIKRAYKEIGTKDFSDDASLFEAYGGKIFLIDGSYTNVKITTPEDLFFVESKL